MLVPDCRTVIGPVHMPPTIGSGPSGRMATGVSSMKRTLRIRSSTRGGGAGQVQGIAKGPVRLEEHGATLRGGRGANEAVDGISRVVEAEIHQQRTDAIVIKGRRKQERDPAG